MPLVYSGCMYSQRSESVFNLGYECWCLHSRKQISFRKQAQTQTHIFVISHHKRNPTPSWIAEKKSAGQGPIITYHRCTRARTDTHTHTFTHTHSRTHKHKHAHTHTHDHIRMHARMRKEYAHSQAHTCACTQALNCSHEPQFGWGDRERAWAAKREREVEIEISKTHHNNIYQVLC